MKNIAQLISIAVGILLMTPKLKAQTVESERAEAPVGTIVAYGGQALTLNQEESLGWYVCNGDSIAIANHSAYVNAVGQTYGLSHDRKYVYLPDLRGLFLRGVNDTRSDSYRDPDASGRSAMHTGGFGGDHVGTIEPDAFAAHHHNIGGRTSGGGAGSWSYQYGTGGGASGGWFADTPNTPDPHATYMGGTHDAGGSSETRPRNASVYWLIKVR